MDSDLEDAHEILADLISRLSREASDKDTYNKLMLADVLASLVAAIQENRLESLAEHVDRWSDSNLMGWIIREKSLS